ncbi:MAG: type III-B CRISPR module-associated protein Cmr5 [Myxococcales bacterium]|nr:type III-B CRISPR module-associated protein Cmr5 [Myxococcales bacterium]
MNREQKRAEHALATWSGLADDARRDPNVTVDDFRTLANGFGPQILRSGLVAAVAFVRRYRNQEAANRLLRHLAGADIPALTGTAPNALLAKVSTLNAADYMLATREALHVALWLRRAGQAGAEAEAEA